jgi:hypothetical protein
MDFQNYPYIRKHFGDSRLDKKHPLMILSLNSEYMQYLENILKELDDTPNLATKTKKMKKPSEWESIFSELEFARRLKSLKPVFVKEESKRGLKTPDIKVNLLGKELFFEVEMLDDTTQHLRIENAFPNSLPCLIMIQGIIYNERTADGLIEFLKNEINYDKADVFSFEGIGVEVIPTKSFPRGIMFRYRIPLESIKKKISYSFQDKLAQFKSCKPIFWVMDCKRFYFSHDSMEIVLYNINDGLFISEEAKYLNGVIAKIHGNTDLFLNPSVEQRLDDKAVSKLRGLLSAKLYNHRL